MTRARISLAIGVLLAALEILRADVALSAPPDFAKEIRPILQRSCYACHGPEKQKSGYRLDVRETALKGGDSGEAAIVPHDAKKSPLVRYASGEDPSMQMPPKESDLPRLSAAEVELLRAWIDAGPAWPDELAGTANDGGSHWSLQPLVKPTPPGKDANPIDAFIHAKLAEKGLSPSPEADRRTLIRRVYYDLTGLPPTPAEVDAFVADADPKAYEKLVDRLLASPRHGERWARHWLDTIHFADTHGYEHDMARDNAWRYRDYVISSLNADKPWARFVREQLAADYLYPDQPELTPALGYLGAGTFDLSTFSTAVATFDYLDRDDLVTQTMSAFVSTTANCARCHAHKFDPISQEDYYALQAVFAGITKGDVNFDADPETGRQRLKWQAMIVAADKQDAAILLADEHEPRVRDWIAKREVTTRWQPLALEKAVSAGEATLARGDGDVYLASGTRAEKDTYTVTAQPALTEITALRLNIFPHDSLPMHGPGRQDNGNLHLSEFEVQVQDTPDAPPRAVKIGKVSADFNQDGWGIDRAIDGNPASAWGIYPAVGQPHYAVFQFAEKLTLAKDARLTIAMKQLHGGGHLIGAFNFSVTADPDPHRSVLPGPVEAALAVAEADRTPAHRVALAAHALRIYAQEEMAKLPPQSPVYAAATTVKIPGGALRTLAEPKVVHVLHRGDFDKPRAVAEPGALSALTHLPARFVLKEPKREAERRAALAEWIAHPENRLVWRSIVNRVWHYHFGRGICDTPSDFGRMGGVPSHPELLDYLAVWFRDDAQGSLKELHRLIVTSETYRQSSGQRDDAAKLDGANRFLWRQHRHRLDADAVRDFALALSGRIDFTMGGPGIQHFKSSPGPQNTPKLDYSAFDWNGPGSGRRSIYRFVWRGIPDPFMEALDFPDLGLLSPARAFSASSLQSLALLNNDFILRQSDAMAKRLEKESPTLDAQVSRAVRLAWLRAPTADEQRDFAAFAGKHGLRSFCRVLLNSNEYLFVD